MEFALYIIFVYGAGWFFGFMLGRAVGLEQGFQVHLAKTKVTDLYPKK